MTYREPADVRNTALFDLNALASEVARQEAKATAIKSAREHDQELERAKIRLKADQQPTRVSTTGDDAGILLRISHLSVSKGELWFAAICSGVGSLATLAILIALPGAAKLTALFLVLATAPAIWAWVTLLKKRRPVNLYAAEGLFVLYRDRIDKPVQIGRLEHLEFDVRNDGSSGLKTMMPKYGRSRILGEDKCDRLTPSDMKTLEAFARRFRIRVC